MKRIVKNYLKNKNILNNDEIFIIAFSGGFDSMSLANILIELSKKYHFKVVLAHLNHNWRGKKSLSEAKNCEDFAKINNIEFYTETLSENLPHTETVAREERYKFFNRVAKKYNAKCILTAHTKSDNIETVLQRIIKGTGINGLKGISDTRKLNNATVYRPLLVCSRADILNYCKENKLNPNNDNSNKDIKYLRNRIRENLIPDLKNNYDENIENAICRLIQNSIDEENLIDELLKEKLSDVIKDETILTDKFIKLILPLKKRIIKDLLVKNGFDYTQKRINEIFDFIEESSKSKAGKTFSLSENHWLFTNNKITEIIDKADYNDKFAEIEINMEGETYLEEFNAVVKISKWEGEKPKTFPKDNESIIYADFSKIELPLKLRTWIYGDRIVPFGKKTPIKLKKYFNNKNLSKQEKSKTLLLSSPKEVLWVINLGISNSIRVDSMPTHKVEFFIRR